MKRMWINQPSTLQPLHALHGTNVYADLLASEPSMARIYFLSGSVIWQDAPWNALGAGWRVSPEALREPAPVNPVNLPTPHKHAALIKAWADGAVIQGREDRMDEWWDTDAPGGDVTPGWIEDFEYRIKPQNTLSFCNVYNDGAVGGGSPLPNKGTNQIHLVVNPDTMELVSATMVKP